MNFNFFKKKKDEDDFVREEEENQFQPYDEDEEPSDTITTEEEEHEKKGRRLKGKVIAGGIALVALLLGYMMLSNLFAPKQVQEETVEERPNVGSIKLKGPSSYEEMAKYDAEKQRQLAEAKKREEELKAAQKKEQQPARQVTPPPSTPSVTPPSVPSAPSVPVIDRGEMAANRSSIGFNVGGNESSVASIYSSASSTPSGHLNMGRSHVIQAGTVVPAVLLMGIDTRMSDMITAQVRQDVYDSLTGRHLLIPQGSRLIGKVGGGNGRRVGVSFERLIMPDGTSMTLPKQNAVDNQGFGGMKDKYDHHDSDFFRGALISAVVGYLSDAVDDHFDRHNNRDNGDAYETAMTKVADNISGRIMDRVDRTEPANAIIRQGFQFNVLITQDMIAYEYMR